MLFTKHEAFFVCKTCPAVLNPRLERSGRVWIDVFRRLKQELENEKPDDWMCFNFDCF